MPPAPTGPQANRTGSLWMIAAMACFALEDVLIKSAATLLPLAEVMVIFGLLGALIFAATARLTKTPLLHPAVLSRPMLMRAGSEVLARLFYFLAITLAPLSSATAILQATPLVVVAGAALFLGERVTAGRWLAILAGLGGVMVMLRPGAESFTPASGFAVLGMLGFAARDLASRAAPKTLGLATLGFYGFVAVVIAGAAFALWQGTLLVWPGKPALLTLAGAALVGTLAYASLMRAMRTGDVSAVTPFRYSRLIFGLGFGVLWFGETLHPPVLAGTALIVASGLYILWSASRPTAMPK